MKKLKHMLIAAVCVSLASQINIELFAPGFMISMAPVVLPIMLYFNRDYDPIIISFFAGIISPLYRGLVLYIGGTESNVMEIIFADILFYMPYGLLFIVLYWNRQKSTLTTFFAAIVISDSVSNMVEVGYLMRFKDINYHIFQTLIIVAFFRAIIVIVIILLVDYYNFLLRRQDHEERYRKLIMITSNVKSEIYFMNKNNIEIENVMKEAYYLYKSLSEDGYPEKLREASLDVAKDVHEIKKDYLSIIKGLEEQFNRKADDVEMNVKDLVSIVNDDAKEFIRRNKLRVYVDTKVIDNFNVVDHYYMVTILKNLINNSIEAIEKQKRGYVNIKVEKIKDECIFTISDNGSGIKKEDVNFIFNDGFSTKFNESTGDICRGIGLSHVKGIVDDVFGGTITVDSKEGSGTKFTVKIKAGRMEGENS